MKKSITLITLLGGAVGAYAQGTLTAGYGNGFTIDVFAPQVATPTVEVQGQGPTDSPVGSTVYTGQPIGGSATGSGPTAYGNGANYSIALFAAPGTGNTAGLTAAEASPQNAVFTSLFQTSGGTGVANSGTSGSSSAGIYAYNNNSAANTVLSGYTGGATMQLIAWYSGGGTTLAADQAGAGPWGESVIASIADLGGNGSPPAATPLLGLPVGAKPGIGLTSFSLVGGASVPEPSTIALGVIGASTLLFRRRK